MTELTCDWVQSRWRIVDSKAGTVLGIHKHLSIGVPLRCVTIANNTRGVIECEGIVNGTDGETGIKADTGLIVAEESDENAID